MVHNLVDMLLGVQYKTYVKMCSSLHNKSKKTVEKETYLLEQMAKYNQDEMIGFEFVQAILFKNLQK